MQDFKNGDIIGSSQSPPHLSWGLVASQLHHLLHLLQKAEFLQVEVELLTRYPLDILGLRKCKILKMVTSLDHHKVPPICLGDLLLPNYIIYFIYYKKRNFCKLK